MSHIKKIFSYAKYAFQYDYVHEPPEHCFSGWECAVKFGAITSHIPNTSVQDINVKSVLIKIRGLNYEHLYFKGDKK